MKKGDIVGFILILGMLGVVALFAFAPRTLEVVFAPVEVEGSALVLVEVEKTDVVVDVAMGVPGFVTLHQLIGDAPGPLAATSELLDEGIHSALVLPVVGGLEAGVDYVFLMAADDGDGVYEPGVDRPVMVDGQVIRVPVLYTEHE
jgi:hypothetical protein